MARRKKRGRIRNTRSKRRRKPMRSVAILVMLSLFIAAVGVRQVLTPAAFAQPGAPAGHAHGLNLGHEPDEPFAPLLDGSVKPQDIPDSVAIRVLMQTLRVPENADAVDRNQLRIRATRLGLGEADFEVLVRELGSLDTRAKVQEARITALRASLAGSGGSTAARVLEDRFVEEQGNLATLVADQYQLLLQSLSPEGRASLEAHLSHVKSRIKVFPTPDMSRHTL